jgi:hypothetical protein
MRPSAHRLRAALLALPLLAALGPAPARAADEFDYRPPEREPRGERTRYVDEAPDIVLQEIWNFLEEQGLTIESVDPQTRLIIARYRGDPRPYIDCGKVETLADGRPMSPPRIYSANKDAVRAARTVQGKRIGLLRELRLDGRVAIRVEPRGKGSRVFSLATFVATKSVSRLRKGGVVDDLIERETISFMSDEPGQFAKGTICVSNGKLEDLPLQRFRTS